MMNKPVPTPIESCISVALHTGKIKDYYQHPIYIFHDNKLAAIIGTDNRMLSNTHLSKEYLLLVYHSVHPGRQTFTKKDVARFVLRGAIYSFGEHDFREKLVSGIKDHLRNEVGGLSIRKGSKILDHNSLDSRMRNYPA